MTWWLALALWLAFGLSPILVAWWVEGTRRSSDQ